MTKKAASGTQPEPSNRPARIDHDDVPDAGPGADMLFELSAETSPAGTTKISILTQGLIHGLWVPSCAIGGVVRLLGASTGVAVTALCVVFVVCAVLVGYQARIRMALATPPVPPVRIIDARTIDTVAIPQATTRPAISPSQAVAEPEKQLEEPGN